MLAGNINWVAIIVSAIVYMGIGWFWYSSAGFGKPWRALMGIKEGKAKEMQKEGMKGMLWGLIAAIVMSYVLAHIILLAGATTIGSGIMTGFWVWLGFYATSQIGSVLWEQKPVKLYYINTLYSLVAISAAGAILAVM